VAESARQAIGQRFEEERLGRDQDEEDNETIAAIAAGSDWAQRAKEAITADEEPIPVDEEEAALTPAQEVEEAPTAEGVRLRPLVSSPSEHRLLMFSVCVEGEGV
jgi:hypothetical protein